MSVNCGKMRDYIYLSTYILGWTQIVGIEGEWEEKEDLCIYYIFIAILTETIDLFSNFTN